MDETKAKTRCPWWLKAALGVSLAVNLAVVGLVAGLMARGGPMRPQGPEMGYALPYVIAMPREARRDMFRALRNDATLPNRRARRDAYQDMTRAIAADPLDLAGIESVLQAQADGARRVQSAAQAKWLDLVADMSAKERADYVARINDVLERGNKREGERRKDR